MGRQQIESLPAEVAQVRVQLDEWRANWQQGRRIPEDLWAAAVRAAGRQGLNRVSRALGLDYSHLKKRSGLGQEKARGAGGDEPVFVELANVAASALNGACVVELEKGNGAKLRAAVGVGP